MYVCVLTKKTVQYIERSVGLKVSVRSAVYN